ncbi:MAG: hypothetical protein JNK81_09645 [Anaerolineales bacterium]|nr:hypothetical protein [Anaerolineales bacterium]
MKKLFFTFITLFSLLALSTGAAFAAPLADGYLELREVRNDPKGGVIFVFDVVGEFSKADFKGSFLTFGDNRFPLDCNLSDAILQCTTSRATAGQYVTLNVGGFIFWTRVPERGGTPPASQYCYGVYDIYFNESEDDYEWEQFDTHCQDAPANFGDVLQNFYNPDYDDYNNYEFLPNSPGCLSPVNVNAYYYICGF